MSLLIKQLMKQQARHHLFPLLLAGCLLLSVTWLQAAEFTIRDAQTRLLDGVYHLEADIRYQDGKGFRMKTTVRVKQVLENGR